VRVRWEGAQFKHHSLSVVNRELTRRLWRQGDLKLEIGPQHEGVDLRLDGDLHGLAEAMSLDPSSGVKVTVRHQWPPDLRPVSSGALAVIQPWEFGCLPVEWVDNQGHIDEFWVPSQWVRQCYLASGIRGDKVYVVRNGVDLGRFTPDGPRLPLGTTKGTKLLFVGGTIARKGIDVLLKSYLESFSGDDDVCLVIKGFGSGTLYPGSSLREMAQAIAEAAPTTPEVLYLEDDLTPTEMAELYRACDVLVHPYRGEGFALPVAEAMACGLAVVTTAGGPTDEFAPAELTYRIPATIVPLLPGVNDLGTPSGPQWWLEPDHQALSTTLRHVVSHPEEVAELGQAAAAFAIDHLGWEQPAVLAAHRLRALANRRQPAAPDGLLAVADRPDPTQRVDHAPVAIFVEVGDRDETLELLTQLEGDDLDGAAFMVLLIAGNNSEIAEAIAAQLDGAVDVVGGDAESVVGAELAEQLATGGVDGIVLLPTGVRLHPGWWTLTTAALAEHGAVSIRGTGIVAARTPTLAESSGGHRSLRDCLGTLNPVAVPNALASRPERVVKPSVRVTPRQLPIQVNVVGMLGSTFGVSENSRLLLSAVRDAGFEANTINLDSSDDIRSAVTRSVVSRVKGQTVVNLLCANSDFLPTVAFWVGDRFLEGAYNVGVWHWELEIFPRHMWGGLNLVDEVWMGSDFAATGVKTSTTAPVHTLPLPIPVPDVERSTKDWLGLPERFVFLFMFDYKSLAARKNPQAVLKAFQMAFPEPTPDGPVLLIKTSSRADNPEADEAMRALANGRPDITFFDGFIPANEKARLIATADALVSLHRSEGYGLTMAEAMAVGTLAIATGYSGNLSFMTEANSALVPYDIAPVPAMTWPYPQGAPWAEPRTIEAAVLMKKAFIDPEWRAAKVAQASHDVRHIHNLARTASFVKERLDHIAATLSAR
jgi:glycosyltransferase involved in cell wall biosynthesis